MIRLSILLASSLLLAPEPASIAQAIRGTTQYKYIRIGNPSDASVTPRPGYALMGGGADLDEAFQWLCSRAAGGDFLVLRAHGDDDYNPYIQKLCKLNSVATLILPSREAAMDSFAARTISRASVIFIAGGDQANYINFWMGTPVQAAMNNAIQRGVPIGGTSAGLAVMGEYAYSAQGDKPNDKDLDSSLALESPSGSRVTIVRGFLDIPILRGVVTDTHFAKRDRMGRLLVFLAHAKEMDAKPGPESARHRIRGIGVEEKTAVLLEPDGHATIVGHGCAYFVGPVENVLVTKMEDGIVWLSTNVNKVSPGDTFDLRDGSGQTTHYKILVDNGTLHSFQPHDAIY